MRIKKFFKAVWDFTDLMPPKPATKSSLDKHSKVIQKTIKHHQVMEDLEKEFIRIEEKKLKNGE